MRISFIFNWHAMLQRPHHMVIQAVSRGHEVDVFSPARLPWRPRMVPYRYANRFYLSPNRTAERVLNKMLGPHSSIVKWLQSRMTAQSLSIWEKLWNGERAKPYDAVIFCGAAPCIVRRRKREITLVYDCVDQLDGFPGSDPRVLEYEDSLASVADVIWAVTPNLADRLGEKHGKHKCQIVPNGCDYDHFAIDKGKRRPKGWAEGRPVIGYVGHIGPWFDWDSVIETARELPNAILWLLGPRNVPLPSNLPDNIVLEGFVSYEKLPAYYAGFDLCLIPFKGDVLLKGVSPIKLYEYLAAGKPVVATSMPDTVNMQEEGIIKVAEDPIAFAQACVRLLSIGRNYEFVPRRQTIALAHSWAARWLIGESMIERAKENRQAPHVSQV